MEVAATLNPPGHWPQNRLRNVVRESSIKSGWPIGIVMENRDDWRPRPTSDGVEAEITIGDGAPANAVADDRRSYDFWKLFNNGRFYTLLSLVEDERAPDSIWFEVRIRRVTEALLLIARIYRRLEASDADRVTVGIRHSGLAGRTLRASSRDRDMRPLTTTEDVVEGLITTSVAELESELVTHVKAIIEPLFVVFEVFSLGDSVLEHIVDEFVVRVR